MRRSAVLLATFLIAGTVIVEGRFHIVANWAAGAAFALSFGWVEGLSVAHVAADPWHQTMTLEGFTYRQDTYALGIGRITLPFSRMQMMGAIASYFLGERSAAEPQTIDGIALRNVSIDVGTIHCAIKTANLVGLSISESDIEDIFDPTVTRSIADGMTKLSASKIIIPEFSEYTTLGPKSPTSTIEKIELDGISHGEAARATIGAIANTFELPQVGPAQSLIKAIKISNLDLPLAARVSYEARESDDVPLKPLYDRIDINSATISATKTHSQIELSAISSEAVKVRPLQTPLRLSISKAKTGGTAPGTSSVFGDILGSVEIGALGIKNMRFTLGLNDQNLSGEGSNALLSGVAAAKVDTIGIENCHVADEDSATHDQGFSARVANFAVHGLDLGGFRDQPVEATSADVWANFVPDFLAVNQVRLRGFDLTLHDGNSDLRNVAPIQVAKWDLDVVESDDGLPASLSSDIEHLKIGLADLPFGRMPAIADLGYDQLDLSMRLNVDFNSAKQQLTIREISLADPDVGAVELAGSLGNATKDLFSNDPSKVTSAALAMRVERMEANAVNAGFFEKFIAAAAKKGNKTPAEVEADYLKSATAVLPAILGKSAASQSISAAAAKFIATPKNFRISATAPQGIGVADLMQISDPNTLLEKLSVSAEANR